MKYLRTNPGYREGTVPVEKVIVPVAPDAFLQRLDLEALHGVPNARAIIAARVRGTNGEGFAGFGTMHVPTTDCTDFLTYR